jgi:hypothetical protein
MARRTSDVRYFTNDRSAELDGLREGGPGRWLRGAGDLTNPEDVGRVFTTTDRARIVGYDIVLAAPRPVSILLAVDPDHGEGLVAAHRASVAASIAYLEERGLVVRDRRDGEERDLGGRWSSVAAFTHGLNRHGEPHLHDHVLVGARPEGSRAVLDSRSLAVHLPAADALYRASLRHEVAQRTPWRVWRSFEGVEHVAGLDEGYRALWGGHHQDRGEKLRWTREQTIRSWRDDERRFESLDVVREPVDGRSLDEHAFAGHFEGRDRIARRDVVVAWADAARFGQAAHELTASIDHLYPSLASSRGVRETSIDVHHVRMTSRVRELGARPLTRDGLDAWSQRSIERSRPGIERSR